MTDRVIRDLEKASRTICKAIGNEKDCKPEKMMALARLVNSLSTQESLRVDPQYDGDRGYYAALGESKNREN